MTPDTAMACECSSSPNHTERRDGHRPQMLILHYTGMGGGEAARRWLCDPASAVSCHYLVHEDGRIVQMVAEDRRAWHAGVGSWRGREDVNSRSIGIEIVNPGHGNGYPDFPEGQIAAVIGLCRDILSRHAIPAEFVLAHSDIAPGRKSDPGEKFPWDRLAAVGIGHYVPPAPARGGRFFGRGDSGEPVAAYQAMLAAYGYGVPTDGTFDEATHQATVAFQRHFRRDKVDGIADTSTIETLHRLLRALPRSPFESSGADAGADV